MPRISHFQPKTPLARLRREFLFRKAGNPFHKPEQRFYQKDLATDLGLTAFRIQQLELGVEALPERHARKCEEIYGISADWLLKGDPRAKPVTRDGRPYSKAIASNSRRSYHMRLSKAPTADDAWHLSLSLEALLSEIRAAVISVNDNEGFTETASLFSEIRDAVLPRLKAAEPALNAIHKDKKPIASRLHDEAERLRVSRDKYEQYRLDLTQQHLGVDEYPIIGPDEKETEFQPVSPKDKTIKFPDKARVYRPDGKLIAVRPMTHEEAIKFQPGEFRPSKPLPEKRKTTEDSPLPPMDDQEREFFERELLLLRQDYHQMDNERSWEEWRPKLERLALKRLAKRRSARHSTEEG